MAASFIWSLSKIAPDHDPFYLRGQSQLTNRTNSFFTVPQGLIATLQATNQTSFAAGLESTGLSASLSDPSGLTVFSTSNSAYEAGTANSTSSAQLSSTLSNHIVPGFKGYLPLLTDGQNLTTLGGTTLTVTVRGGEYFINEAKIVKRDLITDNGVAHVLDKVRATILSCFGECVLIMGVEGLIAASC